jgi:Protein of unknown function (DUF3025)
VKNFEWKALFWERRERVRRHMRLLILGHATLEQAVKPWPGIACKALFVSPQAAADQAACAWLAALPNDASPRELPPLPVFGYPGWLPGSERADFYDDTRYFRGKQDRAAPAPPAPLRGAVP